jgi:hypothetical protein
MGAGKVAPAPFRAGPASAAKGVAIRLAAKILVASFIKIDRLRKNYSI